MNEIKKPGRPKLPHPRKIPKMVNLSPEATEHLNLMALRDNRSASNVIETLLLKDRDSRTPTLE